jgi:hypothetical protein
MFTGCFEEEHDSNNDEIFISDIQLDQPSILSDWKDGEYHDYYETTDLISEFLIKYPNLVNVFSIGKSGLGRNI